MVDCGLNKHTMFHLGEGIGKNVTLQILNLASNNFSDPDCLKSLSEGLFLHNHSNYLVELDLQKCGLTKECTTYLAKVLASKYKLR